MVFVWGLLIGVLLTAAGVYGVKRPDRYWGLSDRFKIEGNPELVADRERRARLAVLFGLILVVGSVLL